MDAERWDHASKRRWYAASVVRDLFGDTVIVMRWGSLVSRRGGLRSQAVSGALQARQCMEQLAKRRMSRGYLPVAVDVASDSRGGIG